MKIPAVEEFLRLLTGMARADAIAHFLGALKFGGDFLGERFALGPSRPVFAGRRRPFNVVGIVMGWIDRHAGAVSVAQRVEEK